MRAIFVADGGKELGSFTIRGRQIAAAMSARAVFNPCAADLADADIIIGVKRVGPALLSMIRRTGKPWVWDILDSWGQPTQCRMERFEAVNWLRSRAKEVNPAGFIVTTTAMFKDLEPIKNTAVIAHHGWARPINPIREEMVVVGYEGNPRYIDGWRKIIERECAGRGLMFVVNPTDYAMIDVVLAVRGETWDGYPSRAWKSNVKVANAQITGTPVIAMPESGAVEFSTGGELFIHHPEDLGKALDHLAPVAERIRRQKLLLGGAIRVEDVVSQYQSLLEAVLCGR